MDNLGFQSNGEVRLKRYQSGTTVVRMEANDAFVNEIVTKERVRKQFADKDNDNQETELGASEARNAEETPTREASRKDALSRQTEGDDLLVEQSETDTRLRASAAAPHKQLDSSLIKQKRASATLKQVVTRQLSQCQCSGTCLKRSLFSLFPFINILRNYSIRQDFMGDVVAGLTVGIMHIPQGMAYAMLATLSPVYGLYTSFFPVLVYFFFGSSKHVSLGTASVVCLMIGSVVTKGINSLSDSGLVTFSTENPVLSQSGNYTGNQSETQVLATDDTSAMSAEELDLRLQFAMSVTFMVGVIQLIMAVFRLGFITDYMSETLISGFTTGVACHVITSQIQNIFTVKLPRYSGVFKLIYIYRDFFSNIHTANYFTVILSAVSVVMLYCTSRFINQNPKLKPRMFMPVPIELIVVVLGTVISYAFSFEETFQVPVISDIPAGLPVPNTKGLSRISWTIVQDAFPIVIVIFSISISIAKLLAKKNNYEVDANQELLAFGVSTVVCSFLSCVAPMAALSRAVVQERVGGRTQVAGLVSSVLLLVVLLAVGQYFKTTPKCVLAAVIVVALRGMLSQIFDLKHIYNTSKINFIVWLVAFISTLVLDVDLGLGVAVAFNLLVVICRLQRPNACLLGKVPGTDLYRDIQFYHQAEEVSGIKIFRFEQSLFFLNKEHFRTLLINQTVNPTVLLQKRAKKQKLLKKGELPGTLSAGLDIEIEINIEKEVDKECKESKPDIPEDVEFHTIIIDCSPWSFIDTMGVSCLTTVVNDFREAGIKVVLANCRDGVQDMFKKTKFYDILEHCNVHVSLHEAVKEALDSRSSCPSKQADRVGNVRAMTDKNGSDVDFKDESSVKSQTLR